MFRITFLVLLTNEQKNRRTKKIIREFIFIFFFVAGRLCLKIKYNVFSR